MSVVQGMRVVQITPDQEEEIRNVPGFMPVSAYGSGCPMPHEIGMIANIHLVLGDPALSARREQIRLSRFGTGAALPPLQAECALMGHVEEWVNEKHCIYCGAKI